MTRKSKAELLTLAKEVMKNHNVTGAYATDDGNIFLPNSVGKSAADNHAREIKSEVHVFGEVIPAPGSEGTDGDKKVAGQASAKIVENTKEALADLGSTDSKDVVVRIEELKLAGKKEADIKKILKKEKFAEDVIEEGLKIAAIEK